MIVLGAAGVLVSCSSGGGDDASVGRGGGRPGTRRPRVPDGGGADEEGGLAPAVGEPIQAGRSIIATADVSIEVEDASVAATSAGDVATATGGFLAQQESRPADGVVTLTLPRSHGAVPWRDGRARGLG